MENEMDPKITAVLQTYDELIRQEHGKPREDVPPGAQDRRMRAVSRETGQLMNILARSLNAPTILELGTSFGYSGIWLAEAARATGGRVITMEMHDYKSAFARDMATKAGLDGLIDFRLGDAVKMAAQLNHQVDFVFLDLWKDLYIPALEAFYPRLAPGAIIVADNMLRPSNDDVKHYARAVRAKPGIASMMLPVGTGIELSRFEPA